MDLTHMFNMRLKRIKEFTSHFPIINKKKFHLNADHYKNREVALLTQHGKESVLAPTLKESIGCIVTRVEGYDTDLLGTFTRDVARSGTQIDAARKKARIGMKLARLPLGIASEGSFGPDPFTGMFSWNVEVLVWIDNDLGIEVTSVAQGKTNQAQTLITKWEDAESFAHKIGFPEHHLIIRPKDKDDHRIYKGISDWHDLRTVYERALNESENGNVFIETDMRAHANPTRMNIIRMAAEELSKQLSSFCPECGVPGFWIVERIGGLPCKRCGRATRNTRAEVYGCNRCSHKVTRERTDIQYADPGHCDYCNP